MVQINFSAPQDLKKQLIAMHQAMSKMYEMDVTFGAFLRHIVERGMNCGQEINQAVAEAKAMYEEHKEMDRLVALEKAKKETK